MAQLAATEGQRLLSLAPDDAALPDEAVRERGEGFVRVIRVLHSLLDAARQSGGDKVARQQQVKLSFVLSPPSLIPGSVAPELRFRVRLDQNYVPRLLHADGCGMLSAAGGGVRGGAQDCEAHVGSTGGLA